MSGRSAEALKIDTFLKYYRLCCVLLDKNNIDISIHVECKDSQLNNKAIQAWQRGVFIIYIKI